MDIPPADCDEDSWQAARQKLLHNPAAGAPGAAASRSLGPALRMVELRHHLLRLSHLSSAQQLLLVERPWRDVLAALPAPVFRHKVGSG